ncbi:GrpB family protein [Frigoribacterium sp. NBH87]|uniref:GrpB family protein n=1 Tax=Frigoribacterium sp. NBH87 TaxID=2596916 RepID=UPI001624D548|nr:GrpB family protein [Frigoribacterium sp. NBH87]QNE43815.1 GrpB family protein [Frigoribacterium sp. NBH87]
MPDPTSPDAPSPRPRRPRTPRRPDVTALELVGGPERVTVTLHEPDEAWAATYLEHRARILDAVRASPAAGSDDDDDGFGDGENRGTAPSVDVEHIGSTSVPGLAAKPIVDVVVAVDDITAEEDHVERLIAAGYELRVREPGHRLVRTPERDVHVHLYERGHPAVDDYLLLRDRLRSDDADRALYESTKRELLDRDWSDMNDYADAKTAVVEAIKARAREAREAREARAGSSAPAPHPGGAE